MRLKECAVTRYGPLVDLGRVPFDRFTLVFGENESGKTLLVDAIIKMLLRRKSDLAPFEGVGRVDERPEGYVVLRILDREFKLPDDGDISSITKGRLSDEGLSAEDFRNVFIVRNSDLGIADERAFYSNVTDRLTGLHSVAIHQIQKKLQEIGRLTNPTRDAKLSDRGDWGNVKSRVTRARQLLVEIDRLEQRIEAEGLETLEGELLSLERQIEGVELSLGQLKDADRRQTYESGREALTALRAAIEEVAELEVFSRENQDAWSASERDIGRLGIEIGQLRSDLTEADERLQEVRAEEGEVREEADRRRRGQLDDLETEVSIYLRNREAWAAQQPLVGPIGRLALVSYGVLAALVLGLLLSEARAFEYLAYGATIAAAGLSLWWLALSRTRGSLEGALAKLRVEAVKLGVEEGDPDTLLATIRRHTEELETRERRLERLSTQSEQLEKELSDLKEKERSKKKEVGDLETQIEHFRERSGASSYKEFHQAVEQREKAEDELKKQAARLTERFGTVAEEPHENVPHWEAKIGEYEQYADRAPHVTFDEEALKSAESDLGSLQSQRQELQAVLTGFQQSLAQLGSEANAVLGEGEALPSETVVDLRAIGRRLVQFVDDIESQKDLALQVLEVFERIAEEEAEKVGELFGAQSQVSRHFAEITAGVYEEVGFDSSTNTMWTRTRGGDTLRATQLSGGTVDQLYLSIRLALATKILGGQTGFFILDDPFLTSDLRRLSKQLDLLRELTEHGWQVVYFTVKEEVRSLLKDQIETGRVALHELSGLHA